MISDRVWSRWSFAASATNYPETTKADTDLSELLAKHDQAGYCTMSLKPFCS